MPGQRAGQYEPKDVDGKKVIWFFVAFFIALAVIAGGLIWLFNFFKLAYEPAAQFYEPSQIPPPPRLLVEPAEDMETFMRREERLLNTYGWNDEAAGVARIPIDRAMDLIVKRGLPVRRGGEVPTAPPYAGAPTTPTGQTGLPPPRQLIPPGEKPPAEFAGPRLTQPAAGGRAPAQPSRITPPSVQREDRRRRQP